MTPAPRAKILSVEEDRQYSVTLVRLEWSGQETVGDWELAALGEVTAWGDQRDPARPRHKTGWVHLYGPCLLKEGTTIGLQPE